MSDNSSTLLTEEHNAPVGGRILVVDDEAGVRSSIQTVLSSAGYQVHTADGGDAAETILSEVIPDVILLDIRIPKRNGLELLRQWISQFWSTSIVLISGEATVTEALEGIQLGAYDFLEKPLVRTRLLNTVARAVEWSKKRKQPDEQNNDEVIVGKSASLKAVLDQLGKIARTKARVLILGESGTGKDLLARAIHRLSARSKQNFVKINCAAIPSELIESQLFGHVKGAFTGAVSARRGLFELANGGTLFLDEIAELSLAAQAKILRALQNGEIVPVGSDATLRVDVRLIAATNKNLKEEVAQGRFREDLYYRLSVVELYNPPLRDRTEDIPLLIQHFAKQIALDYGLAPKAFDSEALELMKNYPWPGNIRELRNVVERLVILGGSTIQKFDLPLEICANAQRAIRASVDRQDGAFPTWDEFKRESETAFLTRVLKHAGGNMAEAARILAVERSTVHKWIKSLGIEKESFLSQGD